MLILSALLIRVGIAHFQREYLLGREVDSFNLKWIWKNFSGAFFGEARSLLQWYQLQIGGTLRKLKTPLLLLALITVFGSVASYRLTSAVIPAEFGDFTEEEIDEVMGEFQMAAGLPASETDISFWFIFSHNVQAILVMHFFGILSFGILGELAFAVNIGVLGALFAVLDSFGLPTLTLFFAGILPHGIFEIPAIIFAGAGILYFGAVLVTPNPTKTMGEVFIHVLADWMKIGMGIILPLLLLAALIETYITPQILSQVMN